MKKRRKLINRNIRQELHIRAQVYCQQQGKITATWNLITDLIVKLSYIWNLPKDEWRQSLFFPAAVQGLLLWKYFDPMITIWCYKFTFYVLSHNTEMAFCFVFYLMRYFLDTCCILFSEQSHCYHMKSRNKVIINW